MGYKPPPMTPSNPATAYPAATDSQPLQTVYKRIENYYATAGPDYASWSPHFNMHFGYFKKFTDLFSLEKMLRQMNVVVLDQLQVSPLQKSSIADLGCGMATVARYAASRFSHSTLTAFTIVPAHIEKAKQLNRNAGLQDRISMQLENFEALPQPDESFTHAYAIESACHAASSQKELFISEMARVLKKGGRFCIADGFLKNNRPKPGIFNWLYRKMTNYWAVPGFATIGDFKNKLEAYGLIDIQVREISYRIAPSVLYVPLVCIRFFIRELWRNKSLRMKKERWQNVYAPLLGMFVGLFRNQFGYYLISGKKPTQ